MNQGSTRIYTPVVRNPRLFHQNTALSAPAYYTAHPATASGSTNLYLNRNSSFTSHSQYPVRAPMPIQPQLQPQSYLYYANLPKPTFHSSLPFSYSTPNATYTPTVATNGLALILIATLVLVALDLMIVRPQKMALSKFEIRKKDP